MDDKARFNNGKVKQSWGTPFCLIFLYTDKAKWNSPKSTWDLMIEFHITVLGASSGVVLNTPRTLSRSWLEFTRAKAL